MYRLGELTEQQRSRYGWMMMALGTLAVAVAVIVVHYAQVPGGPTGFFSFMPQGWVPKAIGYLIGFGGSQLLIVGAALVFVLGQPMTWARATFAALLAWVEFVMVFGIVPSEWLNLAQTDLDWSTQRIALTLPPWLVLGNQVDISWGAIKDAISMGYNLTVLVGAAIFAYNIQDIGDRPARAEKPEKTSPYGRPLVRSDS